MSKIGRWDDREEWQDPCEVCGEPVTMTVARYEVIGRYHLGCFGYPACTCNPPHRGECKPTEPATSPVPAA